MRMRMIKPGFFMNEQLAEAEPLTRILFAGLWGLADREGRLEDRPARIKAEVLPYDRCDVVKMLAWLGDHEFIYRYEVEGKRLICIPTFKQHQSPNRNEPDSKLAEPTSSSMHMHAHACICKKDLPVPADVYVSVPVYVSDLKEGEESEKGEDPPPDPPPVEQLSPQWPADEVWLLNFLSNEQKVFNGPHLPGLQSYQFWDDLSVAVNGIDKPFVEREFAKMRIWLKDNPARAPTPKGVRRFVAGWLERAAERERKKG
jgi:hypothetical protein